MTRRLRLLLMGLAVGLAAGCASLDCHTAERPKTLFEWAIGGKEEEAKKGDEKDKPDAKNGDGDKESKPSDGEKPEAKKEDEPKPAANGNGGNGTKESKRDEPLVADRPDFLEASSTVGRGVVQFEGGYTFARSHDAVSRTFSHSYPEALFRIGLFAEWFELRIGQNFISTSTDGAGGPAGVTGAEDLYLGTKLALTEQKKALPEMAVILQMTVPSGHPALSAGQVLPGVNWLMGWDIVKDRLAFGVGVQANRAIDDLGQIYIEWATAASAGYTLTKRLGAYTEYFAIYPDGAGGATAGAQHYFDGGFSFRVTNNFQLDVRGGVGLNERADDYFFGAGLSIRR